MDPFRGLHTIGAVEERLAELDALGQLYRFRGAGERKKIEIFYNEGQLF